MDTEEKHEIPKSIKDFILCVARAFFEDIHVIIVSYLLRQEYCVTKSQIMTGLGFDNNLKMIGDALKELSSIVLCQDKLEKQTDERARYPTKPKAFYCIDYEKIRSDFKVRAATVRNNLDKSLSKDISRDVDDFRCPQCEKTYKEVDFFRQKILNPECIDDGTPVVRIVKEDGTKDRELVTRFRNEIKPLKDMYDRIANIPINRQAFPSHRQSEDQEDNEEEEIDSRSKGSGSGSTKRHTAEEQKRQIIISFEDTNDKQKPVKQLLAKQKDYLIAYILKTCYLEAKDSTENVPDKDTKDAEDDGYDIITRPVDLPEIIHEQFLDDVVTVGKRPTFFNSVLVSDEKVMTADELENYQAKRKKTKNYERSLDDLQYKEYFENQKKKTTDFITSLEDEMERSMNNNDDTGDNDNDDSSVSAQASPYMS